MALLQTTTSYDQSYCPGIWRNIEAIVIKKGVGGAKRNRTADLLHAMQALSQLSYSPLTKMEAHASGDSLGN